MAKNPFLHQKMFKTIKHAIFGLFSGAKIDFLPFLKMQIMCFCTFEIALFSNFRALCEMRLYGNHKILRYFGPPKKMVRRHNWTRLTRFGTYLKMLIQSNRWPFFRKFMHYFDSSHPHLCSYIYAQSSWVIRHISKSCQYEFWQLWSFKTAAMDFTHHLHFAKPF